MNSILLSRAMTTNGSGNGTTLAAPVMTNASIPVTTAVPGVTNITHGVVVLSNDTEPLIFLQTRAAQGIAGTFAFAAILITCHQVRGLFILAVLILPSLECNCRPI